MLPGSHQSLMESPPAQDATVLAVAFSDFMAASSRLEASYRDLQSEVSQLKEHLSERNRALSESHSENRVMRERLQRILETVPCGVLVLGADGSVQLANAEAAKLLRGNTSGGTARSYETAGAPPCFDLHTLQKLCLGQGSEQEFVWESPEGRTWIAVRQGWLPGALAAAGDVVLTLQDITTRKSAEGEREAARDAVAQAQVSAMLAHEIRNPLASMELFAGLLAEEPEQGAEWLAHLRAGIRSLSGTVNNVLSLHRDGPLFCEAMHLEEEASLAVHFMQPLAQQAGLCLQLLPEEGILEGTPVAIGNRSAFHQVLMNLCGNALRHTRAGGAVNVAIHHPLDRSQAIWCVSVCDTGTGIDPQHLPHIFEAGFSGSGATSGLGLAVSARLAQRMGGCITVESRPGHGSNFTLELARA